MKPTTSLMTALEWHQNSFDMSAPVLKRFQITQTLDGLGVLRERVNL